MSSLAFPHPGIRVHTNDHGITVLRLHYSADEEKGGGEKIYVPEIKRSLSPWAYAQYKQMTDPTLYLKEYEIEAEAALGALIYQLDEEATLEDSFPIPRTWTRRMALDPHPGIPDAFLWVATDPWGDRWAYRELWPSRVCFICDPETKQVRGKAGPCPPDDPLIPIKHYVETMKWLESSSNPENQDENKTPFDEHIFARVIDYSARAFGKGTTDDPEQPNFQQRYEQYMQLEKLSCPSFDDAKKDHDVGYERVNAGLKPRMVRDTNGEPKKRSQIHIFRDKCSELIYQLKNVRKKILTPTQMMSQDPSGQQVAVRCHQVDNLRYVEMANPIYINPHPQRSHFEPLQEGFSY